MLINLTPHAIVVGNRTIEPSGVVARCQEVAEPRGELDGIPLVAKQFGNPVGLPEPSQGTVVIVSALTAQAAWAKGRNDVVCPGEPVRDPEGRIIGCKALCVAP